MNEKIRVAGFITLACAVSAANASLIDRGNGLIYDTVLDVTWLQNPLLAASNSFGVDGIFADGTMDWETGFKWIEAMNTQAYLGFDSWRMPTVDPVNGISFQYTISYDGSTDRGFNNFSTANELSNLFYSTLGNNGMCSTANPTGAVADTCIKNTNGWGLQNTGPFTNLVVGRYWTDQEHTTDTVRAFDFDTTVGQTGTGQKIGAKYVWAVIDGDVAMSAVPLPAAAWVFSSGLVGLIAIGRRKKR